MPFLRNEQGQIIRKDGSVVENTAKGRSRGPRKTVLEGGRRVSHLKVDVILGGDTPMREEYELLLEKPNTLLKHLQAWFAERGHHVNLTAINRHRHRHLATYFKVREAAKMAATLCDMLRREGGDANAGKFVEASQGRFEMLLMQRLYDMKGDEALQPGEWNEWAKTLQCVAKNRQNVEQMRVEFHDKAEAAVKAVEDGAKGGATGKDVVERMKEILGV